MGLPHVVDALEEVWDPADLCLGEQHLEIRDSEEDPRIQVISHRSDAVAEDDGPGHRFRSIVGGLGALVPEPMWQQITVPVSSQAANNGSQWPL